jgi:hypothetical protein
MSVRPDLALAGGYPILLPAPRAPLILLGQLVGRDPLLAHRVGDLLLLHYHVFAYDRLAIQARSVPPPYDRIGLLLGKHTTPPKSVLQAATQGRSR